MNYVINLRPNWGIEQTVDVSQYDTELRTVEFNLFYGRNAYNIPTGSIVTVRGTKRDNTVFDEQIPYSGNVATWTLSQQITVLAGLIPCQIRVTNNGDIIGTANFKLKVQESAFDAENAVLSQSQLPLLETAEQNVTEAKQARDEAVEAIENITLTAERVDGGVKVTAKDLTGETEADLYDGVSPTAEVVDNGDNTYTLTVTDASGTTAVTFRAGNDGDSLTASATPVTGGTQVTISNARTGETVTTFTVLNGVNGQDGADGYSPTVTVSDITGGHRITITDVTGTQNVDVMDGQDGQPGDPGTVIMAITTNSESSDASLSITGDELYQAYHEGKPCYIAVTDYIGDVVSGTAIYEVANIIDNVSCYMLTATTTDSGTSITTLTTSTLPKATKTMSKADLTTTTSTLATTSQIPVVPVAVIDLTAGQTANDFTYSAALNMALYASKQYILRYNGNSEKIYIPLTGATPGTMPHGTLYGQCIRGGDIYTATVDTANKTVTLTALTYANGVSF